MTNTEITAKTLTDIITNAGHATKNFNLAATMKRIADYNDAVDQGEYEGEALDLESATEWLDESSNFPTYVLCPWL